MEAIGHGRAAHEVDRAVDPGHRGVRAQAQEGPVGLGSHRVRDRGHHRHRHLRAHRHRRRHQGRPGRLPVVRARRHRCALASLCYAEFASTVPVAGSAYTFSYASLGELIAWIIGWDLVLEFALGAAAVSVGWAKYFASVFPIPESISGEGSVNLAAGAIVLVL